jgi:hypothetical protein
MLQHPSEPNSFILEMKAVSSSTMSEQTKYTGHGVKTSYNILERDFVNSIHLLHWIL